MDDNLDFGEDIKKLLQKPEQIFWRLISRFRSIMNVKQLILTYKGYVQPFVSYGSLVYGKSIKTLILHLESKTNKMPEFF